MKTSQKRVISERQLRKIIRRELINEVRRQPLTPADIRREAGLALDARWIEPEVWEALDADPSIWREDTDFRAWLDAKGNKADIATDPVLSKYMGMMETIKLGFLPNFEQQYIDIMMYAGWIQHRDSSRAGYMGLTDTGHDILRGLVSAEAMRSDIMTAAAMRQRDRDSIED